GGVVGGGGGPGLGRGPLVTRGRGLRPGLPPAARLGGPASLVLPAATLSLVYVGAIARLTRGGLVDALAQDYVRTARAKGLGEPAVIGRHALRVAIVPVLTYLGPATAGLVTRAVVVESMFEIPGLAFSFVSSVQARDAPVLLGVTVFYCLLVLLANLAVDVATAWLDPRARS